MADNETTTSAAAADRFPTWMALAVSSAVCLAASETKRNAEGGHGGSRTADDKWILSVEVLSMSFSFFSCLAYLWAAQPFVGKIPEIGFAFLVFVLWAVGLPFIMSPIQNVVANANLYFFSWMSLAAALLIGASLVLETTGRDVRNSSLMQGKTGLWYGFAASTIIAMVASSRIYQTLDCGDSLKGTSVCRRTNLGISLGCIGFVTGVGMAIGLTKRLLHVNVELGVSAVSFIMWCFGVGFTTFGSGPGSIIGNLYFATWISFILIVVLFAAAVRDYTSESSAAPAPAVAAASSGDVEDAGSKVPGFPDDGNY